MKITKTLDIRKDGDWLIASMPTLDRDRDRIFPLGIDLRNFQRNPIMFFGHNYRDPWAVIGTAAELQVSQDALKVRPELRAPANESDPMHIILALWRDNILRAASIGFIPRKSKPNDAGGLDFEETELLEISIVPLPANQDALRLALKAFEDRAGSADPHSTLTLTGALPANEPIMTGRVILRQVNPTVTVDPALLSEPATEQQAMLAKRGRVLSAKNEGKLREARDELDRAHANLDDVLKEVEEQPELPREEAAPATNTRGQAPAHLLKGAIPPHESPKADPDAEWDGPGTVAACPAERGALRRMHAWVDEKSDPDAKQSYKLPHHLLDGRVVLRGVNNAKARLAQADIPDEDQAGVERHLTQHQDQFERAAVLRDLARALNEQADEMEQAHHEGSDSERDLADVLKHLTRELGTIYEEVIP
jgi:HK97 family phage prohead protease